MRVFDHLGLLAGNCLNVANAPAGGGREQAPLPPELAVATENGCRPGFIRYEFFELRHKHVQDRHGKWWTETTVKLREHQDAALLPGFRPC